MHVLVLGGTGFIGSHIVDGLVSNNHKVRVIDRTVKQFNINSSATVEYIQASYGDSLILSEALIEIDLVIHAVSSTIPSTSNLNPIEDIQSNLVNTVSLLQAMLKTGVKKIIFLSSGGTVYGSPSVLPISENAPKNPICSYGIIKLAIENYLYLYQELHGFNPIILRVSNPYGPRQGHAGAQGVIGTFIKCISNQQPITLWGDGSVIRDYIYIADLVGACLLAINKDIKGTYNIGSSTGYSLSEIITSIEKIVQKKAIIINKEERNFDIKEIVLDISKAQDHLAWSPSVLLEKGIMLHYSWYQRLKKN